MFQSLRRSLSRKILIMTAATMVVLLGISGILISRDHRRTVEELERRTNANAASLVYNTLLFSMVEGKMDDLQKIMQNAVDTTGIQSLRVVTPDGVIRYSGQAGEVGQPLLDAPLVRLVRRGAGEVSA